MAKYKVKLPFAAIVEVFVESGNCEDALSKAFNEFENYCDLIAVDFRFQGSPHFGEIDSVEVISGDDKPVCEIVCAADEGGEVFPYEEK